MVLGSAALLGAQARSTIVIDKRHLPAGSTDTVLAIDLKPNPQGGEWFIMMLPVEGVKLEVELPDGRRVNPNNALSLDFEWAIMGQGDGMAILAPGMYEKVNHNLIFPAQMRAGRYVIHADTTGLRQDTTLGVMVIPGFGATPVQVHAGPVSGGIHFSGEPLEMRVRVLDRDRPIPNATILATAAPAAKDRSRATGPALPLTLRPAGDGTFLTTLPRTEVGEY
jgi:hypothetical protein